MTAKDIAARLLAKDFAPDPARVQKAQALAARHRIEWADVVKAGHDLLTERGLK